MGFFGVFCGIVSSFFFGVGGLALLLLFFPRAEREGTDVIEGESDR